MIDRVCLSIESNLILAGHPEQQLFQAVALYVLADHVYISKHCVYFIERAERRVGYDIDDEGADEFIIIHALHLLDSNELWLLRTVNVLEVTRLDNFVRVQQAVLGFQAIDRGIDQVYVLVGEEGC